MFRFTILLLQRLGLTMKSLKVSAVFFLLLTQEIEIHQPDLSLIAAE